MNILYFLIACSILVALIFLGAFFWAMKDGQNDDMQTPAIRMLFEDDKPDTQNIKANPDITSSDK